MAVEGHRHSHQQGVGRTVYARGAPGHMDFYGTRGSDNHVKAS
jgi:hypothetical protein